MYETTLRADRMRMASWRARGTSVRVGQPVGEPVSVGWAKLHSRLTDPVLDEQVIPMRLRAARRFVENYTHRMCLNQILRYTLEEPPECAAAIVLPFSPVVSVTSVTSYNTTDAPTVMASNTYFVDIANEPGRILLHDGISWPSDRRLYNGLVVEYIAGYGLDEEDVPEEMRQAIFLLAGEWNENREASTDLGLDELPFGVKALLDPYRVMG